VALPRPTQSTELHLDQGFFCQAACTAWGPETATLGEALTAVLTDLDGRKNNTRTAWRNLLRPTVAARFADARLDQAVVNVSQDLLAKCDRSREHPKFRQVFLTGETGSIINTAYTMEPALVAELEQRLRALAGIDGTAAMAERLRTAREAATTTYGALEEARRAYRLARTEEELAKDRLRDALARTEGALLQLFPRRRGFVRSFFLAADGGSTPTPDTDTTATPTEPTTPTGSPV
jgi:hypothetical protein